MFCTVLSRKDRTRVFQTALSCSVLEITDQTQIMKCMSTQGLSNPTKKFGRGLKTASVEAI